MRKVLLISPHFPPDSSAATHRVRLLAPHLERYGWQPTVLTVDPEAYEGVLDFDLMKSLPSALRVVRARAPSPRVTRRIGIGDLGIRSFAGLYREATALLRAERYDALFITIFPAYTALLGPMLVRRFKIPFVLDYQDPWVGAWGATVGGGQSGRVDLKSRLSRALAKWLEPRAVRAASAITAVSAETYSPILARNPNIRPITAAIPIGVEPLDFETRSNLPEVSPGDGLVHICYVGSMLPLGYETLRAVLRAVRSVRDREPDVYRRLRLHFVGTSNQTTATNVMRVAPVAREIGVEDVVDEVPTREPYSRIIQMQRAATALLAMGSSEWHYTASKIYPMLLTRRPLLAVYHERSTVVDVLERVSQAPSVRLVTYSDDERAESKVEAIYHHLIAIAEQPVWNENDVNTSALSDYFACNLAGRLAEVLDRAAAHASARQAA